MISLGAPRSAVANSARDRVWEGAQSAKSRRIGERTKIVTKRALFRLCRSIFAA
jgi:hypothetical protein